MENGFEWRSEFQNAPVVWPDKVRPDRSVMVPEIITGRMTPASSKASSMPNSAALALSVSKMVSTRRMSAPPSINPLAASLYAMRRSSNVTARKPGFETSGEMEAVRLVGPSAPATKRFLPSLFSASIAACTARRVPSTLSSRASASMP